MVLTQILALTQIIVLIQLIALALIDDASIEDKLLSVTNSDEIAGTVAFENSSKLVFKSVVYVLVDCVPSLDNIPDM
jgi:hypothetical protein